RHSIIPFSVSIIAIDAQMDRLPSTTLGDRFSAMAFGFSNGPHSTGAAQSARSADRYFPPPIVAHRGRPFQPDIVLRHIARIRLPLSRSSA
ncbi:hypothetical protein, partial [Burkholderia cenocepacia]|uniref:hypothetical protein n=1 Tax=Burkholderia cenocepacia TaxID=95486 RepID=UPI002AB7524B